jgi:hypothetical protein
MEFFINDPNLERYPPADTRILDLHAEPAPDGKRLRVTLELTPFQKRPDLELSLNDSLGSQVSAASIIEPVGWKLELTLHIRKLGETAGKYTLTASLSYPEMGEIDHRTLLIDIPVLTQ